MFGQKKSRVKATQEAITLRYGNEICINFTYEKDSSQELIEFTKLF